MTEPLPIKDAFFAGWGNFPRLKAKAWRPEKWRDVAKIMATEKAVVARGYGRAYGDAALGIGGMIDMTRRDFLLECDATTGRITAEAGVSLSQILELTVPKGWVMPVMPGTKQVTLGGMIASDVHGKNHSKQGSIGQHIVTLELMLADGTKQACSPTESPELFWATIGGMGLTGVIKQVTLQLLPVQSGAMAVESQRTDSLQDMLTQFEESGQSHDYRVGWIDALSGEKGIFSRANHALAEGEQAQIRYTPHTPSLQVNCFVPVWVLNRWVMRLYNRWRFRRVARKGWTTQREALDAFFFPLDGIANWNRLYGKRGLLQFQGLIPQSPNMAEHLRELLRLTREQGSGCYLAVLKAHGKAGEGMLSFPLPGYSLALDFPNTTANQQLLRRLNEYVIAQGGRVYLAKDVLLTAPQCAQMYSESLTRFQAILATLPAQGVIRSLLADRLGLTAAGGEK